MLIWLQLVAVVSVVVIALSYTVFAKSRRGVITGVLHTIENTSIQSSVIIDGQILKEGDSIYGVMVVKIRNAEIEFRKDNKKWKQRIRQQPDPAWKELD